MNTLVKVGVASALSLGYVAAHAAATVPSSSNPGDVFLFADVISGGSVIKAYAADTTVSVNNTTGTTGTLTPGSTVYAADSNLQQLIALSQSAGNTLQWAVLGGGGTSDASGGLSFVTTDTNTSLGTLTGRTGVNLGSWYNGWVKTASTVNANTGANASVLANSASNAGGWDPTVLQNNVSLWYGAGPTNQVTGLGTSAELYGVSAASSTSTDPVGVSKLGLITLTNSGLTFAANSTGGGGNTVPLPAAVWLLGSGLLGLAGVGRRKLKAA